MVTHRIRTYRWICVVSSVATAIALVAFPAHAASGADTTAAKPVTSASLPSDANSSTENAAQIAANSIVDSQLSQNGSTFGGVALGQTPGTVDVFFTTLDPAVEESLQAQSPDVPLSFHKTPNTFQALRTLTDKLSGDFLELWTAGTKVMSAFPNVRAGHVVLSVVDVTAEQVTELKSKYGAVLVIEAAQMSDMPHAVASRASDTTPWNGGDFISDGTWDCTSGIPVHNAANQKFLLTASHCFAASAAITNKSVSIPVGAGTSMGSIYSRDNTAGGLDAEILSTSSSNLSWVGGTVTSTRATFAGAGPVVSGSHVCVSGAFEGEFCGATVQNVDGPITLCLNDPCTITRPISHVSDAYKAGSLIVGSGDSGGPVYQYFGSTIKANGTITAQGGSQNCTNWFAQLPGRHCSAHVYFTQIANELALWGLIVN
jgi:hypothetical protein